VTQPRLVENLARVRDRIAEATLQADRASDSVTLVAVSKYVDAAATRALLEAGCPALGESRPQQLWDKAADPALATAQWHLIGHLQRNKVARTLPCTTLIHSVDSLRLLEAIDAAASTPVRVLLEVNCSLEAAKQGLTPEGLEALLAELPRFPQVQVCGLMTMAARSGGPSTAARNFEALRALRDRLECPAGTTLEELSMGMSGDFEEAIRAGATLVRIGSLLWEGVR
jgi:pyridoxal phosphate enzyme (YggS family)